MIFKNFTTIWQNILAGNSIHLDQEILEFYSVEYFADYFICGVLQ